jgi:hypothetical protein
VPLIIGFGLLGEHGGMVVVSSCTAVLECTEEPNDGHDRGWLQTTLF